eukprot:TRINITY_DN109424_c0_g1_i1.p1 TRINITY_DN109424_c0_g1~~TRINITY_DN109424_c0_g1_i1.p1  ORF type:complete len:211 (-),score=14.54 TRINITY_DN109424_c0_g1_i1:97-729(-)
MLSEPGPADSLQTSSFAQVQQLKSIWDNEQFMTGRQKGLPTNEEAFEVTGRWKEQSRRLSDGGGEDGLISPEKLVSISELTRPSVYETLRQIDGYRPRHPRACCDGDDAFFLPSEPKADATLFKHLGLDTLFFVFYYQRGTYQQSLAACALRSKTWCFHLERMTWFRRYDQPSGDVIEPDTYIYFDYESWTSKITRDKSFHYVYFSEHQP